MNMLEPSVWYIVLGMSFAYKEQESYISPLASLLTPLSTTLWMVNVTILVLATIFILSTKTLIQKWRHFYIGGRLNRSPILNMWALVLGRPNTNPFITNGYFFGNFARALFLLWIILWFIIRSSYEGALYFYLQGIHPTNYDMVYKVLDSNCKIEVKRGTYIQMQRVIKDESRYIQNLLLTNLCICNSSEYSFAA